MINIIVPYRNRRQHRLLFLTSLQKCLQFIKIKNYQVIIVQQQNNNLFNRGTLLNIGFMFSAAKNDDLIVIHDVDQLPVNVDYQNYNKTCVNLINPFYAINNNVYSSVISIISDNFLKCNGFSNEYVGWGCEDDDFFNRLKLFNINKNIINTNSFYSIPHKHNGLENGIPTPASVDNFLRLKNKNFKVPQSEGLNSLKILSYEKLQINEKIWNIKVDF